MQMSEKIRVCEYDNYPALPPITQRTPETEAAAAKAKAELQEAIEKLYNETH